MTTKLAWTRPLLPALLAALCLGTAGCSGSDSSSDDGSGGHSGNASGGESGEGTGGGSSGAAGDTTGGGAGASNAGAAGQAEGAAGASAGAAGQAEGAAGASAGAAGQAEGAAGTGQAEGGAGQTEGGAGGDTSVAAAGAGGEPPDGTGTGQPGDPCEGNVDCTPGSVCWNNTCVGHGSLRFSLAWTVISDFDLHVEMPDGTEVYYGNQTVDGADLLDVDDCVGNDCADPEGTHVENIFWADTAPTGTYLVWAENYNGGASGDFTIGVEGADAGPFSGTLPASSGAMSEQFTVEFTGD